MKTNTQENGTEINEINDLLRDELINDCVGEINEIIGLLRNFKSISEFLDKDFIFELTATKGDLRRIKDTLANDYKYLGQRKDLTLIALELYTRGQASWERAGEISGLGIFGLEEYVNERGVDRYKLRIDHYLDFTGPEAEKIIKSEWDKLTNPLAKYEKRMGWDIK